jgi:diamine N-acetyltransferase
MILVEAAHARAEGTPEIYLTVFDHNARAKRFCTHQGFAEDRIWRKPL